jgi:type II secretory pathway component PulF
VPLVCVGCENGSLGPAIAQALAARTLYDTIWQSIVGKLGYICILPAVGAVVVAFLVLKIVPQYNNILKDFNFTPPGAILALTGGNWLPPLGQLLAVVWCLSVLLLVYGVLRYAGLVRWDLPGMGWFLRRRHIATVLDTLALAAQQQQPLGAALSTLASSYPQRSIERRLWAACDDLQAGGDDLQCLHRRGLLGKTDLVVLQSARRNGNLAWAAREMADSNRRRFIYGFNFLLQAIFPPVIVAYGLLVAAIAISMFLPLVAIISRCLPK